MTDDYLREAQEQLDRELVPGHPLRRVLEELIEARRLARLFWHWALWLDSEMNSAFCAEDMEELERLRVWDSGNYEEWRHIREAGKPDWLKEKP